MPAPPGTYGPENTPVIGVARWEARRGGVGLIYPDTCPRGHDLRPSGSMQVDWHHGHAMRMYTCNACYRRDPYAASWCVRTDHEGMWRAWAEGGGRLPEGMRSPGC